MAAKALTRSGSIVARVAKVPRRTSHAVVRMKLMSGDGGAFACDVIATRHLVTTYPVESG